MTKLYRGAMRQGMDPVLRIVTVTLLLFSALGVIRHPHPWRWKLCFVLFLISVSSFVINNTTTGILSPKGMWWILTLSFVKMLVLFAWWLVQCSFSDRFRFDAFRLGIGALWLGVVIFATWRWRSGISGPLDYTSSLLLVGLMLHLVWFLISGREDDLRLRRRDVRLWLPIVIIGLLLIDAGVDLTLGFDWYPAGFLFAQNAAIFTLVCVLAITITTVDANILAAGPPEKTLAGETVGLSQNAQRIDDMMRDEKMFLKPDLKLSDIVARLPVSEAATRKLIHTEFGCEHFRTFLNRYRIEHALGLLKAPAGRNQKLIAIAFDSGFASLSSFQRAFKRETGKTPSMWRLQH